MLFDLFVSLEQEFKVEVKVIQADFSKGQIVFDHISKEIEGIEIGILSSWILILLSLLFYLLYHY